MNSSALLFNEMCLGQILQSRSVFSHQLRTQLIARLPFSLLKSQILAFLKLDVRNEMVWPLCHFCLFEATYGQIWPFNLLNLATLVGCASFLLNYDFSSFISVLLCSFNFFESMSRNNLYIGIKRAPYTSDPVLSLYRRPSLFTVLLFTVSTIHGLKNRE